MCFFVVENMERMDFQADWSHKCPVLILFDFIFDCLDWLVAVKCLIIHQSRGLQRREEKRPAMELLRGFLPLGAAVWQCVVHDDTPRQCLYNWSTPKNTGCVIIRKLFTTEAIRSFYVVYMKPYNVFHMITSYLKQDIDLYRTCMPDYACVHLKMADLGHHHCLYSTSCTGNEVILTQFYHRFPIFLNTDMHHQQTSAGETNWCGKVLESECNHFSKMLRTCQFIHDHLPHAACLHHPI